MSTLKRLTITAGASIAALALAACGQTVQPGDVGLKIHTIGSQAGIEPKPLAPGFHFNGFGDKIIEFPVIIRPYSYSAGKDPTNAAENEEISFSDNNALQMTGDVQVSLRVRPEAVPALYTTYRMSFDDLIRGQVRNDIRSAIAAETELVAVDYLYHGGRQEVIRKALKRVQAIWAPQGVEISKLEWIGNIRYPAVITAAIQAKTKADADQVSAQARVAVATAEAQEKIEAAKGEAEANRLIAASVQANPAVAQLKAIEKWDGVLPTTMGAGALPFINVK